MDKVDFFLPPMKKRQKTADNVFIFAVLTEDYQIARFSK